MDDLPEIDPERAFDSVMGGSRPERRDAAEHRERILDTARMLFTELGVDAVSMHQIAQTAGVGQGTLYRRYAHKGELCMDMMRDSVSEFWNEIDSYLVESAGARTARERLDTVLVRCAGFVEEKALLLSTMGDASCGQRRSMEFENPFYTWLHQTISDLLQQAVDGGERPPMDVTFTADAILAALRPDLYLFQRHERGFTPEQIIQGLRHTFIDGLTPSI